MPLLRLLPAIGCVFAACCATLTAQRQAPRHLAHPRLEPWRAFRHLAQGHERRLRAGMTARLEPATRPAGAGRWLAAVTSCADADFDPGFLFAQRPRDLLRLRSPGPRLDAGDLAALERAVRDQRLSLCLILTHEDCPSLEPAGAAGTDAERALARATAAARAQAGRQGIPVAEAQARLLRQALLADSELLRQRVAASRLAVVAGVVEPRTGRIRWLLDPIDKLPMPPVK